MMMFRQAAKEQFEKMRASGKPARKKARFEEVLDLTPDPLRRLELSGGSRNLSAAFEVHHLCVREPL